MSRPRPVTAGRPRPLNTVVLLRDAYLALNDLVVEHLTAAGHPDIRPAHSAVFEHLDESGTTVSALADRAQMTKQAMAELVAHLERHDYVERIPDPTDRRAKLVQPTERGRALIATAQSLVPELEGRVASIVGPTQVKGLHRHLEALAGAALT